MPADRADMGQVCEQGIGQLYAGQGYVGRDSRVRDMSAELAGQGMSGRECREACRVDMSGAWRCMAVSRGAGHIGVRHGGQHTAGIAQMAQGCGARRRKCRVARRQVWLAVISGRMGKVCHGMRAGSAASDRRRNAGWHAAGFRPRRNPVRTYRQYIRAWMRVGHAAGTCGKNGHGMPAVACART